MNLIMVNQHSLKHGLSNYTVPEMQSSEEEDSDNNQSADEVLQSYSVV